MSYEGYEQVLCEKGHLSTFGCWDEWQHNPICHCGAKLVWWNAVDETNGSFEMNPTTGQEERIDGYVELEVLEEGKKCEHCGSMIGETTYKVPQGVGHAVVQKSPESCFRYGSSGSCGCWNNKEKDEHGSDEENEERFGVGL
jgi:hypothetical protein